jgi:hypothetical protein
MGRLSLVARVFFAARNRAELAPGTGTDAAQGEAMNPSVRLDRLEDAFLWADSADERSAFVTHATGAVHLVGGDMDPVDQMDPVPDELDDDALHVEVPDKRDLDLGQRLAMRFMEDVLPARIDEARAALHRRGGWRAFKDLLDRAGQLQAWHDFENAATRSALRDWAEFEGFTVVD